MKDKIFPFLSLVVSCAYASEKPNLIVIQTDEHTINTLGCYRRLVGDINDSPWGKNVVQTPNIDRLAKEGAICTRYYASSPVSTPSRASFQTGLYPVSTGCPINDMPMNPNLITYAEMLKRDGYQTSYVGKWHLGGVPNIGRPYFEPGYNFGYMDRTYMFNDGHWKYFEIVKQPNKIRSYWSGPVKPGFIHVTEYLTDRCLELLERDKNKPFYMMLSIPDPHSPDIASEEYLQKYINLDYEAPETMVTNDTDQRPRWARGGQYNVNKDKFDKKALANYFAMVEMCIRDRNKPFKNTQRFKGPGFHETYNMGHFLTLACVHYRVTKDRTLLDAAIKVGDFLDKYFAKITPELADVDFNPTQIMGLMELYRSTGEKRYLDCANRFITGRGNKNGKTQNQNDTKLRKEHRAVGHAVLGPVLYIGAADYVAEINDKELLVALETIWNDMYNRKASFTGDVYKRQALTTKRNDHKRYRADVLNKVL